jgi:hypothetical protein
MLPSAAWEKAILSFNGQRIALHLRSLSKIAVIVTETQDAND